MSGFASGQLANAICDRCRMRYPYRELMADGNNPSLRVCKECRDPISCFRLPPRQPENITLRYPRPDAPLVIEPLLLDENGRPISITFEDYLAP